MKEPERTKNDVFVVNGAEVTPVPIMHHFLVTGL